MKILIENGTYECHNAGDLTMLKVCVERIANHFPDASLITVSESPDHLIKNIPHTDTISLIKAKVLWAQKRNIFGYLHRLLPFRSKFVDNQEIEFKHHFHHYSFNKLLKNNKNNPSHYREIDKYYQLINDVDCCVVSGGGFITDDFEEHAIKLLETVYLIAKQGKPVAFFGQGIGPISSPELIKICKKLFPLVSIFALRENSKGPALLKSLGVKPENIYVTGDDAIEHAAKGRTKQIGSYIGFNIRIAKYASVDKSTSIKLVDILNNFSESQKSHCIPVPISWHHEENDLQTALSLLDQNYNCSDHAQLESIEGLTNQISKCRMVVTGSYHAAVFALSQGIPVIAIAKSQYYLDKFKGLSDMFVIGLTTVCFEEDDWVYKFQRALEDTWKNSAQLHEKLINKANDQIELSKNVYKNFSTLIQKNDL